MKCAMVINGYLRGAKFDEPASMMSVAAERQGIGFRTILNNELNVPIGDPDAMHHVLGDQDFILFWDKDVLLARNLEICGYNVFNCAECIRICDDKSLTHIALADCGIPSIRTMASPMTFGMPIYDYAEKLVDSIGFPMVVKDCFGSFGQQVRLVKDEEGLRPYLDGSVPRIFQQYIECGSTDIRVEVVGGKVVAAVRRKAKEGDFRSNSTLGGTMTSYVPTEEESELAIAAAESVEADFAGVDIMQSSEGPLVCEVNSNAHIKNLRDCTGIDVSDAIFEHIQHFLR